MPPCVLGYPPPPHSMYSTPPVSSSLFPAALSQPTGTYSGGGSNSGGGAGAAGGLPPGTIGSGSGAVISFQCLLGMLLLSLVATATYHPAPPSTTPFSCSFISFRLWCFFRCHCVVCMCFRYVFVCCTWHALNSGCGCCCCC